MPINLRVGAEFDEERGRKAKEEADAYYKNKEAKIKLKTEFDESAARATDAEVKRYFERQSAKIKIETEVDRDSITRATSGIASEFEKAGTKSGGSFATGFLSSLGTALPVGVGGTYGLAIAGGIAEVLIDITKGAVTASQSIALIPAGAAAAGAAMGTLALATQGFSDAIKNIGDPEKFATDLQSLAPSAQQAALSIQDLMPSLKDLQQTTQNTAFAGMGEEIHKLVNEYLPEVKSLTTSIADSFNNMLKGVGDQLLTPATQLQLQNVMNNISASFQNLVPAAQSFSQALIDITSAGSDFLPELARDAADVARNFADFIRQARDSGQLREFIQNGIDAVKVFGDAIFRLGQILYQVFGSDGQRNVNDLKSALDSINEILGLLTLDTQTWSSMWNTELSRMQGPLGSFRDMILDIPEAFTVVENKVIDFANFVIAQLNRVVDGINLINPFSDISKIPAIAGLGTGGDWSGYTTPPTSGAQPSLGGGPNAQRERRGLPPITTPNAGLPPYGGPFAVPPPPPPKGSSGSAGGIGQAQVPYGPGFGAAPSPGESSAVYSAQQGVFEAQHRVAESQAQLTRVQNDSKHTTDQLIKAQNDVTKANEEEIQAQLRLQDALTAAAKKADSAGASLSTAGTALTDFNNKLDADLGLSKGLPGLADNLVRFLGNLAAAPLLGPLSAISNAQGGIGKTGSGLIGIAAAQGAFGQQFTPAGQAAAASVGFGGGIGTPSIPSASLPGVPTTVADIAAGGSRVQALYALADSLEGTPYSQALRNDCSGIMNQLVNAAVGLPQPSAGQRFSTPTEGAFLQSHGFTMTGASAAAPPGSFRIGWNPAPGNAGHTAGTLPGGENVEQGGSTSGFTVGPGAAGASSPQFSQHAYLPMGGQPVGGQPLGGPIGQGQYAPMPDITNPALYDPRVQTGTFDKGGWLQPGITIAQNTTGKPEPVGLGASASQPLGPGGSSHPAGQAGSFAGVQGAGTAIGGGEPKGQPGASQSGGGLFGAAVSAGALAADAFAPGSGAAVQIAGQEIQRAIKFGGQAAAIGIGGLLDTFLPFGGSDLAQNNWITKIAGGFAAVQPQIPNIAGKSASVDQMNKQQEQQPGLGSAAGQTMPPPVSSGRGSGPAPGPGGPAVVNHITYNNNGAANAPSVNDLSNHLTRQYQSLPGLQR